MQLQRVSELKPELVSWLWPGRLALGKLAMLDGDPGLGKSLLALDLCARLSTGRPMPDGSPGPNFCNALVLNAEDSEQDTIRPRLLAPGADLGRIFVLRPREAPGELLRLPTHTAMLEEALAQTQARLVVLDPIVAFLDRTVRRWPRAAPTGRSGCGIRWRGRNAACCAGRAGRCGRWRSPPTARCWPAWVWRSSCGTDRGTGEEFVTRAASTA